MPISDKPNPGSNEAIELGCECPIFDNARGLGYLGGVKDKNGKTMFVISAACKLHHDDEERRYEH